MPLSPTVVDLEGLFAYARVEPGPRRAFDREVTTVTARTPRGPLLRAGSSYAGSSHAGSSSAGSSHAGSSHAGVRPRTALARRLAELELVDPALAAAVEDEAEDGASLLERVDRVARVETEVSSGELRTDRVAARLAALAGPVLRHASFEQIALTPDEVDEAPLTDSSERSIDGDGGRISSLPDDAVIPADAPVVGLSRLRAHVSLTSWEIFAIDRGPWLDLPAILGLLNAILRHLDSEVRLVVLRGHDARARVLAAPRRAIETAVAEGLFELEGPDDALLRSFGESDDVTASESGA